MGRSIFSSSNSGLASASSKLKAAAPFVTNDIVQMMFNGQAAPVRTIDYAVVQNAGTAVLPGGTSATNNAVTQQYSGSLAVQGPDGSIYYLKTGALDKYTPAGVLIQSYAVNVGAKLNNIFWLSNGNLCITGFDGTNAYYCIYIPSTMVQVVAPTVLTGSSGNSQNLSTVPLSGGGFAAFYNSGSSFTVATLAIYNNAGALLNSATMTTSGSGGFPQLNLAQLSNGNIVVAYLNPTIFVAIYNTVAAIQVAPFNTGINPSSGTYFVSYPVLSVMVGYFSLASAAVACMIFNNAGVQQGATFSASPIALAYPAYTCSVVNDGTTFWLVYLTASAINYVSFSTAGVGTAYSYPATFQATSGQWSYFDASTQSIVTWFGATAYCVFNTVLLNQAVSITTIATGMSTNDYYSATSSASQTGLVMLGDGAFFCYGGNAGGVAYISIWKSVNTAIIGVATGSAVVGSLVSLFSQAGVYYANTMKGSLSKTFDHSTGNIYGNKGVLTSNNATLRGM